MKTLSDKLLSDSPLNLTFQEKMLHGVQKWTHSYGSALFVTFAPLLMIYIAARSKDLKTVEVRSDLIDTFIDSDIISLLFTLVTDGVTVVI